MSADPLDAAALEAIRAVLTIHDHAAKTMYIPPEDAAFGFLEAIRGVPDYRDAIRAALAAPAPADAGLDADMECPMCGGTGRLVDITDAIEAAQAAGQVLVPLGRTPAQRQWEAAAVQGEPKVSAS